LVWAIGSLDVRDTGQFHVGTVESVETPLQEPEVFGKDAKFAGHPNTGIRFG